MPIFARYPYNAHGRDVAKWNGNLASWQYWNRTQWDW